MVRVAPRGVLPEPHVQARRRHAARADPQRADRLARERVLDLDLVGLELSSDPADRQIPTAVDHKAREAPQAMRDRIGTQPLAGAARVERHAHRPRHGGAAIVDRYSPPQLPRLRARRPPGRRRGQRLPQRCRSATVERGRIARALQRTRQRGIDQPTAAPRGPDPRAHGDAQQRRGGNPRARIAVQRAQLAVAAKARQARREVLHVPALALRRRSRRRQVAQQRRADQQANVAAHRVKRDVVCFAHDTRVTDAATGASEPELEPETDWDTEVPPARPTPAGSTRSTTVVS